jgi:hypothetical protein
MRFAGRVAFRVLGFGVLAHRARYQGLAVSFDAFGFRGFDGHVLCLNGLVLYQQVLI